MCTLCNDYVLTNPQSTCWPSSIQSVGVCLCHPFPRVCDKASLPPRQFPHSLFLLFQHETPTSLLQFTFMYLVGRDWGRVFYSRGTGSQDFLVEVVRATSFQAADRVLRLRSPGEAACLVLCNILAQRHLSTCATIARLSFVRTYSLNISHID